MSTSSSNNTGATLGKILAGAFLHDFTEGGKTGPQMIQLGVGKLRKYLGRDQAKAVFESSEKSHNALVCACLDQIILDQLTPETREAISKLDTAERVLVEALYLKLTGQDFINTERNGRWADPLWKMRWVCRRYLNLSPTEVKPEELLQTLKDISFPLIQTLREHVGKSL